MRKFLTAVTLFLVFIQVSCAPTPEPRLQIGKAYAIDGITYQPKVQPAYKQVGLASWYGRKFHKKRTANGDVFDKEDFTAAHKTLPLPSIVVVTNLENGKSIRVKVNDRGPFVKGRIIDVSENAARSLGFKGQGTTRVKVELDREASLALLNDPKLKMKEAEKKLIQEAYAKGGMSPSGKFQRSPSPTKQENGTNIQLAENTVNDTRLKTESDVTGAATNAATDEVDERTKHALTAKPAPEKVRIAAIEKPKKVRPAFNDAVAAEVPDAKPVPVKDEKSETEPAKVTKKAQPENIQLASATIPTSTINKVAREAEQKTARPEPQKSPDTLGEITIDNTKQKPESKKTVASKKTGGLTIQIASTTSKAEAEKILAEFKNLSGKINEATVNGRKYFRVRVNGFNSQTQAQAALQNIKNKGFKDAFITKN